MATTYLESAAALHIDLLKVEFIFVLFLRSLRMVGVRLQEKRILYYMPMNIKAVTAVAPPEYVTRSNWSEQG